MNEAALATVPVTLEPPIDGEVLPPKAKPKRPKSKRLKDVASWAAMTPELWEVDRLLPSARNARLHSPAQVKAIAESMKQFGFTIPVLVDETGDIIAGHGRLLAAQLLKLAQVPVIIARGWTEEEKRAYRLMDNQLTISGEWDIDKLKIELTDLQGLGFDVEFMGFDADKLAITLDPAKGEDPNDGDGVNGEHKSGGDRGELLSLINIAVSDPRHECKLGDHYELRAGDEVHDLLCYGVIGDWKHWVQHLIGNAENAVFCPFPGSFVPFSTKAKNHRLVMVQPNLYICGHILDRWTEVHGSKSVVRVTRIAED